MSEQLHEHLRLRPFPQGDPPPYPWEIIRQYLTQAQQLAVANAVLEAEVAIATAHLAGLKKVQGIVAKTRAR
jgi:hypothetical protein